MKEATNFNYTVSDFKSGDTVRYVPNHAHGDTNHPDCEDGVVSSCNEQFVFVKYYTKAKLIRGKQFPRELKLTSQATDPTNLIKTWPTN